MSATASVRCCQPGCRREGTYSPNWHRSGHVLARPDGSETFVTVHLCPVHAVAWGAAGPGQRSAVLAQIAKEGRVFDPAQAGRPRKAPRPGPEDLKKLPPRLRKALGLDRPRGPQAEDPGAIL